jgi:hypothetical protein
MELTEKELSNLEDSAKIMTDRFTFNKVWYDVVISLINEIRRLRKKYEK